MIQTTYNSKRTTHTHMRKTGQTRERPKKTKRPGMFGESTANSFEKIRAIQIAIVIDV